MEGPIEGFLSVYPKPATRRVYRSALRAFLGFVDGRERSGWEPGVRPAAVDSKTSPPSTSPPTATGPPT